MTNDFLRKAMSVFVQSVNNINTIYCGGKAKPIHIDDEDDIKPQTTAEAKTQEPKQKKKNEFVLDKDAFENVLRAFKLSVKSILLAQGVSKDDLIPQDKIDFTIFVAVKVLMQLSNNKPSDKAFNMAVEKVIDRIKIKKLQPKKAEVVVLPSEDEASRIKFTDVDDAEIVDEKRAERERVAASVAAILAAEEKAKENTSETFELSKMAPLNLDKKAWKKFMNNPISIIEDKRVSIFDYNSLAVLNNITAQQKDDLLTAIIQCFTKRDILKFLMRSKLVTKFRLRGIDNGDYTKPYFEAITNDDKLIVLHHKLERDRSKKPETMVYIAQANVIKQEPAA